MFSKLKKKLGKGEGQEAPAKKALQAEARWLGQVKLFPEGSVDAVKEDPVPGGLHRMLTIQLQAEAPADAIASIAPPSSSSSDVDLQKQQRQYPTMLCEVKLEQHLPSGAYIDMDEIRNRHNFGVGGAAGGSGIAGPMRVDSDGVIDVELPAQASPEHVVTLSYTTRVTGEEVERRGAGGAGASGAGPTQAVLRIREELRLPVHLRYPPCIPTETPPAPPAPSEPASSSSSSSSPPPPPPSPPPPSSPSPPLPPSSLPTPYSATHAVVTLFPPAASFRCMHTMLGQGMAVDGQGVSGQGALSGDNGAFAAFAASQAWLPLEPPPHGGGGGGGGGLRLLVPACQERHATFVMYSTYGTVLIGTLVLLLLLFWPSKTDSSSISSSSRSSTSSSGGSINTDGKSGAAPSDTVQAAAGGDTGRDVDTAADADVDTAVGDAATSPYPRRRRSSKLRRKADA